MITIIVIIILAAAVILTLTNNNPITNAKQASFVNDLDSFKSELDMYKASEYAKRIGDFEQTSLQGTEGSLTFEGQTPAEAGNQTMYTAIPSLKGISKYQGQFAIKDGQLVYMGKDTDKRTWAEGVGVKYEIAGEPKITSIPPAQTVVEPATDVVYTIRVTSTATLTMISDLSSKIKVTDNSGVALATQPQIVLGALTGTNTLKEFTVTVKTTSLPYGSYKIKVESGIATNAESVPNQEYITVNAFEIADNIPPLAPEITATPTTVTSGNVTVTIDYKDANVKLYSFTGNTENWQTYTTSLTITTNNTTIYAMGKDSVGNETGIVTKTIANIDRVAPTVTFGTNGGTNATEVSTTITVSDDKELNISTLQYVLDTQNITTPSTGWTAFTNGACVSQTGADGTYYLWVKASDIAGNNVVVKSNEFIIQSPPAGTTYSGATTGFNYNDPIIPTGFTALNTTDASWDNLGTDWDKGLIIQDSSGNEFVWVPVDGTNVTYAKWCITGTSYTSTIDDTLPTGITSESTQISKYKGFYLARFEAGKVGASTLVSKKGATVWHTINYTNSKSTAEAMYTGTKVKSGLITGRMWDTTMKWIQNSGKNVTLSRSWGNYYNATSPANVSGYRTLRVTGYSEYWKAKNIYDLAGNVAEWTNEKYNSNNIFVRGGGYYDLSGICEAAAYRQYLGDNENTNSYFGFRVALYII